MANDYSAVSLPMIAYIDKELNYTIEVVDVLTLYPDILNNTFWRDAYYQMMLSCYKFYPAVFGWYFLFICLLEKISYATHGQRVF